MCSGSASFRINTLLSCSLHSFATLASQCLSSRSACQCLLIWRWCKVKDHWHSSDIPIQPPLRLFSNLLLLHLLSFRLWASPIPNLPPSPHFSTLNSAAAAGLRAAADVVWRAVRSEIQCIIILSEDIMMETSQSQGIMSGYHQSASFCVQR